MYERKTRDRYVIEQDFGGGWVEVKTGEDVREGRKLLMGYRLNQPQYPVRMRKRRERI